MRSFCAIVCSVTLLCNSVAIAGGLGRGLVAEQHGVSKLVRKLTQGAGALAVTAMLACGMSGCAQEEVAEAMRTAASLVTTLDYERSSSIDELVAAIEATEGAQVGVVKSVNQQGLVLETDDGDVHLQLAKGEVLINNSDTPVKVTLLEEALSEGLIAEGSLWAIIPAAAVTLGLFGYGSVTAYKMWKDGWGAYIEYTKLPSSTRAMIDGALDDLPYKTVVLTVAAIGGFGFAGIVAGLYTYRATSFVVDVLMPSAIL